MELEKDNFNFLFFEYDEYSVLFFPLDK